MENQMDFEEDHDYDDIDEASKIRMALEMIIEKRLKRNHDDTLISKFYSYFENVDDTQLICKSGLFQIIDHHLTITVLCEKSLKIKNSDEDDTSIIDLQDVILPIKVSMSLFSRDSMWNFYLDHGERKIILTVLKFILDDETLWNGNVRGNLWKMKLALFEWLNALCKHEIGSRWVFDNLLSDPNNNSKFIDRIFSTYHANVTFYVFQELNRLVANIVDLINDEKYSPPTHMINLLKLKFVDLLNARPDILVFNLTVHIVDVERYLKVFDILNMVHAFIEHSPLVASLEWCNSIRLMWKNTCKIQNPLEIRSQLDALVKLILNRLEQEGNVKAYIWFLIDYIEFREFSEQTFFDSLNTLIGFFAACLRMWSNDGQLDPPLDEKFLSTERQMMVRKFYETVGHEKFSSELFKQLSAFKGRPLHKEQVSVLLKQIDLDKINYPTLNLNLMLNFFEHIWGHCIDLDISIAKFLCDFLKYVLTFSPVSDRVRIVATYRKMTDSPSSFILKIVQKMLFYFLQELSSPNLPQDLGEEMDLLKEILEAIFDFSNILSRCYRFDDLLEIEVSKTLLKKLIELEYKMLFCSEKCDANCAAIIIATLSCAEKEFFPSDKSFLLDKIKNYCSNKMDNDSKLYLFEMIERYLCTMIDEWNMETIRFIFNLACQMDFEQIDSTLVRIILFSLKVMRRSTSMGKLAKFIIDSGLIQKIFYWIDMEIVYEDIAKNYIKSLLIEFRFVLFLAGILVSEQVVKPTDENFSKAIDFITSDKCLTSLAKINTQPMLNVLDDIICSGKLSSVTAGDDEEIVIDCD